MSGSDDTRVVNMRINNKDFLKGSADSLKALSTLNKGIDGAGKGKGMQDLSKHVDTVKTKFGAMQIAGVTALANITNRAVNAGINLAKSFTIAPIKAGFKEYEKLLTSTQTIMANTGADSKEVGKYLDELNHYSDQTIYNFGQMADSIGKFTAAGVGVKEATTSIKGIANSAALAGSTTEQLNTMMIQMSQALATGTIKAQDWMSVNNAGMGGTNMQKSLKATAKTLGDHGAAMDAAFKKSGNFKDSLKSGWLTADVFNKTMKVMAGTTNSTGKTVAYTTEQLQKMGYAKGAAEELHRLSQASIDSATKIKTFSQLIDVVKEALGSGWASIFRTLFGNLEESIAMWTNVGNTVTGAIDKMFGGVQGMLEQWRSLGGYQKLWAGVGNIFKSIGNLLRPFVTLFQALMPATDAAGSGLYSMTDAFYKFSVWLEKVTSGTGALSPIIEMIASVFKIVASVIVGVIKYFVDLVSLFSPLTSGILDMVGSVGKLVSGLIEMADIDGKIESLFNTIIAGRRAALEPVIKIVTDIAHAFSTLIDGDISGFKTQLSDAFGGLGPIGDTIANVAAKVQTFFDALGNSGNSVIDGLINKFSSIAGAIVGFGQNLGSAFSKAGDAAAPLKKVSETGNGVISVGHGISTVWSKTIAIFKGIGSVIGSATSGVAQAVRNLFKGIFDTVDGMDKFDWANLFSTIFSGAIILTVMKFVRALSATMTTFKGFAGAVTGVFTQATSNLKTMQQSVKAQMIMMIAISVGVLAASLWLLSKIPAKDLAVSLGAVGAMMAGLTYAMKVLSEATGKDGGAKTAAQFALMGASMLLMATAILVLSAAVLAFGMMDTGTMVKGFAGIAAGLTLLVAASIGLSAASPSIILGAAAMVIMSVALAMLSGVILLYSTMDWDTVSSGLEKMGVVLLALTVSMAGLSLIAPGVLIASAALLVLSIAMTAMLGTIALFAGVSWGTLLSGVLKLAAAIVIIGVAGLVAAPGLIALGIAAGLIGVGLLAAGAGMVLLGIGLAAVAAAGTAAAIVLVGAFEMFLAMLPLLGTQLAAGLTACIQALADKSPEIVEAVVTIATELLKGFTELQPKVIEATIKLIRGLLDAIVELTPDVIEAAGTMLVDFLQGIADKLPDVIDAGTDIVVNFLHGIGENAEEMITAAGDMVLDLLEAIDGAVVTYTPQIVEEGRTIAGHLISGIVLGLIPQPIKDAFTGLVDSVLGFFKGLLGINSPSTVFMGFGQNIVQGLVQGIGGLVGSVTSKMGEIVRGIVTTISSVPGKIKKALSGLGGILKGAFTGAFSLATGAVSAGVRNVGSGIGKLPGIIRGAVGAVGTAAKDVGSKVISGIKDGLKGAVDAVGGIGDAILSGMKRAINTILPISIPSFKIPIPGAPDIHFGGKTLIGEFAKGTDYLGKSGIGLVGEVGPELVSLNRGSSVITNKNLVGFMNSVTTLTKALTSGSGSKSSNSTQRVSPTTGQIIYTVSAGFQGDPKSSGMMFAANLAAGLITGMNSSQPLINSAMANSGTALSQSFADVLGIHSPSRVFYTYAGYVGKGFVNGLLASVASVKAAAVSMAKSATDTVSKTITDTNLKLEAQRAKAAAYSAAAADLRQRASNKKLKKNAKKSLQNQAADYTKKSQAATAQANATAAAQRAADNRAAEAKRYASADSAGKRDIKNAYALTAAQNASKQRQQAIKLSAQADLIRSRDWRKAKTLDKQAAAALKASKTYATQASTYAKEATVLAAKAKTEAAAKAATQAASSVDGTPSQITSISAADILKAQATFDQYTKLMSSAQAAAAKDAPPPVTYNQYNNSPESLSPAEVYRQTRNLLSTTEKKLVGAAS